MVKIIKVLGLIGVMGVLSISPSLAFDRNAAVAGARTISNSSYTYNVVKNVINAGPTFVGSSDHSLPAYAQIAQITAQIQALKQQMKNFSHN